MPYQTNHDLPERVRYSLPQGAQSIFREAFNHAVKQYGEDQLSFKVAWAAVKRKYEKRAGKWVRKRSLAL